MTMDGIKEKKAGNRPVSAFRATFLRHHPHNRNTLVRKRRQLLRSLGSRIR